jgi:hypothetical protein
MPNLTVIGTVTAVATPSTSITLDLQTIRGRVSKLLRRDDIDSEIDMWIALSYRELCDKVNFWELRDQKSYDLSDTGEPIFYDLPDNYSHLDRIFYLSVQDDPTWGRNLYPLPRKFYGRIDFERTTITTAPVKGPPRYYWIEKDQFGLYPRPQRAAQIQLHYYRLPNDLINDTDVPDIHERYRQYLIWIAYLWGQIYLEKEDPQKIILWEGKKTQAINTVKRLALRAENQSLEMSSPPTGLEKASDIYG